MHSTAKAWEHELEALHHRLGELFRRPEPRQRLLAYLKGRLGSVERKNGWQLAEWIGEATPDGVQHLLERAQWDADAARDVLRGYVVEQLGERDAVLIVDETGFVKKGQESIMRTDQAYNWLLLPIERNAKGRLEIHYTRINGRGLVEQILAYSRSQRAKRVPVDVVHVVAETLELSRGSLPANIRLETSAPESPLVVIGDATRLHQIVMNLCSNAIQAMRTGGTLRVALEAAEFPGEQALSHRSFEPGRYVRLIVEDSGSGMDKATLARIFEPFFTTKEVGQGTGLGLALVYFPCGACLR
jgi:signal transduction histidine kinase